MTSIHDYIIPKYGNPSTSCASGNIFRPYILLSINVHVNTFTFCIYEEILMMMTINKKLQLQKTYDCI